MSKKKWNNKTKSYLYLNRLFKYERFGSWKKPIAVLIGYTFSQFIYANNNTSQQEQKFQFYYDGIDINSVSFVPTSVMPNDGSMYVNDQNRAFYNIVTVALPQLKSSKDIAFQFNTQFYQNPIHMLEIGHYKDDIPKQLDYVVNGMLYINGELASREFTLGHDSKHNNNWWIGSNNGIDYTPSKKIRYMDVETDTNGITKDYCLEQNDNNFSVTVKPYSCQSSLIKFKLGAKVKSISLTYKGTYNDNWSHNDYHYGLDYLQHVSSSNHDIQIFSRLIAEPGIADSFNQEFKKNIYSFYGSGLVHGAFHNKHDLSYNHVPESLYFFVKVTLNINGEDITDDFTVANGPAADKDPYWWIASNSGKASDKGLEFNDSKGNTYCISTYLTSHNSTNEAYIYNSTCDSLSNITMAEEVPIL